MRSAGGNGEGERDTTREMTRLTLREERLLTTRSVLPPTEGEGDRDERHEDREMRVPRDLLTTRLSNTLIFLVKR